MVELLILLLGIALFLFLVGRFFMGAFRRAFRSLHSLSGLKLFYIVLICLTLGLITHTTNALPILIPLVIAGVIAVTAGALDGATADFFLGALNAILQAFADLICVLIGLFGDHVLDAIAAIPIDLVQGAATITGYLEVANHWAPIAEGALMLAGYLTFLTVQLPLKLFVKLFVPTVG